MYQLYYYCRCLMNNQCFMMLYNVLIVYIKGSILMFCFCFFILWVCYWVICPPLLFVFTASVAVLWSNPYVHFCGLHTGKNTDACCPCCPGGKIAPLGIISSFLISLHQWKPYAIITTIKITHKIIPIWLVLSTEGLPYWLRYFLWYFCCNYDNTACLFVLFF